MPTTKRRTSAENSMRSATPKYERRNIMTKKPLFLLVSGHGPATVGRCYCAACNKLSYLSEETLKGYKTWDDVSANIADIACPECGEVSDYVGIVRAIDMPSKDGHVSYNGAWELPMLADGRFVYESQNSDGDVTKIEDNMMFRNVVIFPSGKTYQYRTEYSLVTDLESNAMYATRTRIDGTKRENEKIADSVDGFQYTETKNSMDAMKKWGINHPSVGTMSVNGVNVYNSVMAQLTLSSELYAYQRNGRLPITYYVRADSDKSTFRVGNRNYRSVYNSVLDRDMRDGDSEIDQYKVQAIVSRFAKNPAIHPVYLDTFNNGLFLNEHHVGSNESNTTINEQFKLKYLQMMVKYPAAFEYACERADMKVTDWMFKEKRKAESDASYTARTDIPDSLRAKYFRDEMEYIAAQLTAVDDKILLTVANSKDAADMKKKLGFYAFGKNSELAEVPNEIKLKGGETLQAATNATKKLKKAFNTNPIATASNVYTCQKLGIRDINHVMSVIDIANGSPSTHMNRHKKNGRTVYYRDNDSNFRSADVIVPVRDAVSLSFLKNYHNARNTTTFINDVFDEQKWSKVVEDIRIYSELKKRANVVVTKDDNLAYIENLERNRMAAYLEHKPVKDAYVDFIENYGKDTKKTVDKLVYQVQSDAKLRAMKRDFDKGGFDLVKENHSKMLEHFPPYCDHTEKAKAACKEDIRAYTEKFFTNYTPVKEESKVVVTTRNGKGLFEDRNIDELHDELVHMYDGVPTTNTLIDYSDKEKALEAEYDAPDMPEGTKWSFHLHKDTNEMIRTASELHNCLKSHTDMALRKSETLLFMRNELGEKVACISLRRWGDGWMCDECQSDRDRAIDERYKDIVWKWCEEHNITDGPNNNLHKMGQRDASGTLIAFHGANADYHSTEIDETTGAAISVDNMRRLQENRLNKAREVYGVDADGNINVPTVPDMPDYLM